MHGFSTADGFVEITKCLAEMIKYVANEPSVGLFYVQQHCQNAVPNLVSLKNNVMEKSHETVLHTEDLDDSITIVRSMKECGFPIADEMIKDTKKSLVVMSTKQPKRGTIHSPSSSLQMGGTSSWGPASWNRTAVYAQQDGEGTGSYLSTVLKSAKQKASNFKWAQSDPKELKLTHDEKPLFYPSSLPRDALVDTASDLQDMVAEVPLSIQTGNEIQEQTADGLQEVSVGENQNLLVSENYDEFRADKEAKLEEWLRTDDPNDEKSSGGL